MAAWYSRMSAAISTGYCSKSVADGLLRFRLRFELRHPIEPADRRDAGQHPTQLGMGRHAGLNHDGGMLRIDARRNETGRRSRGSFACSSSGFWYTVMAWRSTMQKMLS